MVMIIKRGRVSITVPDEFLKQNYQFGKDRLKRIKALSGLSWTKLAEKCGLSREQILQFKIRNPCPDSRVRLAFVEAEFLRKKNDSPA